ncbi:hypothetical protein L484_002988 [Morus notabilis]|uniref:X8 domain-containing protein n=1 Tax=Morus notabilis TaxID=981085 RepID=W9QCY7_9ROSA|nr:PLASMODESMATA CALLOSE-BINDING PROTEIN 5 isoform X1 [Morus notabilis]EXB28789.1 hypothetical protein L484_002988 [Morus notabilis]
MGKIFDFPLLLLLLLTSLHSLPLSGASLHCQSKAQNGVVTMELWCVAKNNAEDTALQTALDWACGPGGADCGPIQQGGPCYDASDVQTTASYAFNNYYLKNGMTDDACNFDNTAALTSLNPSHDKCKFPSSLAVSNGSSLASPSTAVGLGPSEDMNGCSSIAFQWFWPIFSTTLFFFFTSYL